MMTFILYIILFIVLVPVILLGSFARLFLGVTRRRAPHSEDRAADSRTTDDRTSPRYTYGNGRKKIFDANDGEYVDFEEIKE